MRRPAWCRPCRFAGRGRRGVKRHRQVGGADGLAQEAHGDAILAAEEHLESRIGLRRSQLLGEQPRSRVGKRRPEAIDLLKSLAVVDGDERGSLAGVGLCGEVQRMKLRKSLKQIRRGLVNGDGLSTGGGNSGQKQDKQQESQSAA